MANVTFTSKVITEMAAIALGEDLGNGFLKNLSTALTDQFAQKNYKVGDTVEFWKDYRFIASNRIDFDPQAVTDQLGSATVNQWAQVGFQWGVLNKTLEVREGMKRYVRPVVNALRAKIAIDSALYVVSNALGSVGTPGTPPSGPLTYLNAMDVLVELGMPQTEKPNLVVNRKMSTPFVDGTKALFNPVGTIKGQFDRGRIDNDTLGFNIFIDQSVPIVTNGIFGGTPLVNLAQSAPGGNNATMTLNTDGWSSGATALNQYTKFTIGSATSATVGGVNSVHPQSRVDTGRLQVISVVNPISDTTGTINMLVAPALSPTGQYQNVTTGAVDNAIITVIGTSGASMTQGCAFQDDAFGFLSVPIQPLSPNGVTCTPATDPKTGFCLMHSEWGDGNQMNNNHRWDTLYGFYKNLPELAVVTQA